MNVGHFQSGWRAAVVSTLFFSALAVVPAMGQTCFTSDDMDPATRSAIQSAAQRYSDMAIRGDFASLKQNSIPAVANNFSGIEATVREHQSDLAGAHATPRTPFLLKAEGTAPLPKAEFLCGIFDARGQTKNSAEFVFQNLPAGNYGVETMDITGGKTPYTLSLVLQEQGTDWKIGGFFLQPSQIAGHDSNWFLERARAFKAKGQAHNAYLYFVKGLDLAAAPSFMFTQLTDKLYDEEQTVKPTDFPADGKTAQLTAANGKTYTLTSMSIYPVGQDLNLVVRYQAADISNTGQAFQENMNVMRALTTKFPELRDAFAGIDADAVDPAGRDYATLMAMKDIK